MELRNEKLIAPPRSVTVVREAQHPVDLDSGSSFVAHLRMNGARLGWIDISIERGDSSLVFDIKTEDGATRIRADGQLFGVDAASDGRITILATDSPPTS